MANNQYKFLDYAGLSLFWNNVKSIIEENELATATALTNLDTKVDNVEASKADKGHEHTFNSLTSKPTTISGYGITDALTTSNYTSYTVKKDGTGATGTWGISITGNANYATTAGSAPASDVKAWAKADTKPSYTGTEVTLTNYSNPKSYTPIASGDSVQAAIAKLEGALSGLEDLLASI